MPAENDREKQDVDETLDQTHSDGARKSRPTPSRETSEVRRRWSGDS